MTEPLDIKSKAPWPAGALSNFAAHAFTIDGIACASMEGFLQSLKIADAAEQARVCTLVGEIAQGTGQAYDWRPSQTLWWRGEAYLRRSPDYQTLLDRAYQALHDQSQAFREALAATGGMPLAHSVGKDDPAQTVLTVDEMISRLGRLRDKGRLAD